MTTMTKMAENPRMNTALMNKKSMWISSLGCSLSVESAGSFGIEGVDPFRYIQH